MSRRIAILGSLEVGAALALIEALEQKGHVIVAVDPATPEPVHEIKLSMREVMDPPRVQLAMHGKRSKSDRRRDPKWPRRRC